MKPGLALLPLLLWADSASAHGFGGAGFLHPLTGPDHMLAMIAVGAWSAQLGGPALWAVPTAFVLAMSLGGAVGMSGLAVPLAEPVILASAILLGAAIAIDRRFALPLAAAATALFGFAHGFAHGAELPAQSDIAIYAAGVLVTTAGLHVLGLAGGLLILADPSGRSRLRLSGLGVIALGFGLLVSLG